MTLFDSGENLMLKINAKNNDGRLQRGKLTPAKKKVDGY